MTLFFLLPLALFSLLVYLFYVYAVRRHNRFLLWLALFLIGYGAILSGQLQTDPSTHFLVGLWAYAVVFLPVWWMVRAIVKAWRS